MDKSVILTGHEIWLRPRVERALNGERVLSMEKV